MPATRSSKKSTSAPDAIQFIESDHETLRNLLGQLEETTSRGAKKRMELLEKLGREIRSHAKMEEEIFYPAFHEAAQSEDDEKKFLEATEEHGLVDIVLPDLEAADPTSDVFGAKAKVLKDLIEHHAEEEEEEMLPRSKKLLGAQRLAELGEELAARKKELLAELGADRRGGRSGARR